MRFFTFFSFTILWCYPLSIFSLTQTPQNPDQLKKNKRLHLISNLTSRTLMQGEFYFSELAIAYGITNQIVLLTNLASIAGINESEQSNPNFNIKYKLVSTDHYNSSVGLTANQYTVTGVDRTTTQVTMEETSNNPSCPKCVKEVSRTVLSVEKNLRKWREQLDIVYPIKNTNNLIRNEYSYKKNISWNLQLYYTHSLSFLILKNKQLNLHFGGHLEINPLAWEKGWLKRPSFRIHSGLEIAVSQTISILGELFYDPDYYNWLTNKSKVGLDFGIRYAYTPNIHFLFHLQPYFIGFSFSL